MSAFDIDRHRRDKLRRLEAQVEHLIAYRARLERVLALLLRVAASGSTVEPLALLAALEDLDAEVSEPTPPLSADLLDLLGVTA